MRQMYGYIMQRSLISDLTTWFNSKNRKPLVLCGARQVGKSSLIRLFAQDLNLEIDEINLEKNLQFDSLFKTLNITSIETELSNYFHRAVGRKGSILFLDEVQATPHALAALRYFYEERPNVVVIAAGSLLEFALQDAKFSMPVGRIEFLNVEPMNFEEFLLALNESYLIEKLNQFDISQSWSDQLHTQLLQRFREFLMVGGMPEVVQSYATDPLTHRWSEIQNSILSTYREDFHKYGKRTKLIQMNEIFSRLPGFISRKIKYSELAPNHRSSDTRGIIDLFAYARVVRKCIYSPGQGLPIGAEADPKSAKIFFLDVGLVANGLGMLPRLGLFSEATIFEGPLSEQYVAQHLASFLGPSREPTTYYWRRESRQSNAEVDFLVQFDQWIIPVEVKSGTTGSLRSLHQFMITHKNTPLAVKLSAEKPLLSHSKNSVLVADGVESYDLKLLTLPIYMTGQLNRILGQTLQM